MLEVKVLGPGCQKCQVLLTRTKEVIDENQFEATVTKIEDIMEIMKYNIMSTPALVLNDKVVIKGMVPTKEEIKKQMENLLNG
jgi:small redox-active disulfide protein 2